MPAKKRITHRPPPPRSPSHSSILFGGRKPADIAESEDDWMELFMHLSSILGPEPTESGRHKLEDLKLWLDTVTDLTDYAQKRIEERWPRL